MFDPFRVFENVVGQNGMCRCLLVRVSKVLTHAIQIQPSNENRVLFLAIGFPTGEGQLT